MPTNIKTRPGAATGARAAIRRRARAALAEAAMVLAGLALALPLILPFA